MPHTVPDIRLAEIPGIDGLEEATADSPRARRNLLAALWAARRLGLAEGELAGYCRAVMEADHDEPGDADVLRRLAADLAAAGRAAGEAELRAMLVAAQRRAFAETLHHD